MSEFYPIEDAGGGIFATPAVGGLICPGGISFTQATPWGGFPYRLAPGTVGGFIPHRVSKLCPFL